MIIITSQFLISRKIYVVIRENFHTSTRRPILSDQRYISNTSWPPAATNSAVPSSATHENCTGLGEVNVLKFRYLKS